MARLVSRSLVALPLAAVCALGACTPKNSILERDQHARAVLDTASTRFIVLALGLGRSDSDYVDSFYGDSTLRDSANAEALTPAQVREQAELEIQKLDAAPPPSEAKVTLAHRKYLRRQFEAMAFRARLVGGEHFTFDEESHGLYDATAPHLSDAELDTLVAKLETLLPGWGPLVDRYQRFRRALIIPPARLDTVFKVAIAEARRRTLEHLELPDSESFKVEYVHNQPWSGYNWYQGGYRSLIQVNVDLPIYADRALDLACHEGYPGHHVQNMLLEQEMVRRRHWREFTILPLFSPTGMIDEGSATVAASVAFPGRERQQFEKRVLFPLAGLDTTLYDRFDALRTAMESLSLAQVENARAYLDGRVTREQLIERIMKYELQERPRAEHSVAFIERYRTYRVNYPLGHRLVLDWLDANGGSEANPARRWELYSQIFTTPTLPSDLAVPASANAPH